MSNSLVRRVSISKWQKDYAALSMRSLYNQSASPFWTMKEEGSVFKVFEENPSVIERFKLVRRWLYSRNENDVILLLGRTSNEWGRFFIFYVLFYLTVFTICGSMLFFFLYNLDQNVPRLQGLDSPLKMSPSLGYRPMPDYETNLIHFQQGRRASYKVYVDHIEAFLKHYDNDQQVGENFIDCSNGRQSQNPHKTCRFDLNSLGFCNKREEYGFDEGRPCIFLKLNKIYGWVPELENNETGVRIDCHGEESIDRDNIGPITYYPTNYFPADYFPYLAQDSYRSPLVAVRFENPVEEIVIMVECVAHAINIPYNRAKRQGSVHFELLID